MNTETETETDEEWTFDYEPHAASHYSGDHECQYGDCDETADWLIDCGTPGYTGGQAFFCCQRCSRKNRIYAKENELYRTEISEKLAEVIPDGEVQHVNDLKETEA